MSAVVKCSRCGEYVPFKGWPQSHKCGIPSPKEVNFETMSHKQVLDYFLANPEKIEQGLHNMLKEVPIFRGRIDLIGRDKSECLCLIEVVHRSHYDRGSWIKKLQKYRNAIHTIGKQVYNCKRIQIRLLLKKTQQPVDDVTHAIISDMDEQVVNEG